MLNIIKRVDLLIMAKTQIIKIVLCLLLIIPVLAQVEKASVWFAAETPYLLEIESKLLDHDYRLQSDSLKAEYQGELLFYALGKDSIRCEIQLSKSDKLPFVLDSFNMEPESQKNVRSSVLKFSIWMLILNAVTSILFFARST